MGENLAELTEFDYGDDVIIVMMVSMMIIKIIRLHPIQKKYRHINNEDSMDLDSIEPIATKYSGIIDKISFIDEEIFSLKVTSKLNKKSQRKWESNNE
ncbi:hypothetical protein Glove_97g63 [Diversispora epigaea]|uniref:Uncharacterized protein n=1 Tax=Diversispora epigaea TaxID=1348612 RepID=A0A397J747_9GLOM|nr:hypothetical protein Glove_97g63 [Diversispora epigaea]